MKYLIACDLDGSLLNKDSELTKNTINTLRKLDKMGHIVVLVTGRPFQGAIAFYNQLEIKTPLIVDNGATIENPSNKDFPVQKTYIPVHLLHELFKFSKPFLESAFFSDDKTVYAYRHSSVLTSYFTGSPMNNVIETEFDKIDIAPSGLVFLVHEKNRLDLENYIDSNFNQVLAHRYWGTTHGYSVYEIYLRQVSKSTGIKYLLDYYNLSYDNVLAFGDGVNDLEMIRDARLGVALKNAITPVINVAKDVTKYDHDNEGVHKYLVEFFNL